MFDGKTNARAAKALFDRDGWAPWNSSRGGQVLATPRAALAVARASAKQLSGVEPQVPGTGAGQDTLIAPFADAANRITKWITTPKNIGRVITVVIGGAIIIVGGAILIGGPALKTVKKYSPVS
jgi:hypothetical protein